MVNYCVAYGCKEKYKKGSSVTFHSFPTDPYRRKLWELKVRRENFSATRSSKICSKHFTPDSFDNKGYGFICLKRDAVPTVFVYSPLVLKMKRKIPEVNSLNDSRKKVLASNEASYKPTVAIKQEDESSSETLFNSVLSKKTSLCISNETLVEPDVAGGFFLTPNETLSKPFVTRKLKQLLIQNEEVPEPVVTEDLLFISNETLPKQVESRISNEALSERGNQISSKKPMSGSVLSASDLIMPQENLSVLSGNGLLLSNKTLSEPKKEHVISNEAISGLIKQMNVSNEAVISPIASRDLIVTSKETVDTSTVSTNIFVVSNRTAPTLSRDPLITLPIKNKSLSLLCPNQPVASNSMFCYPQQFLMSNNNLSEATVHSTPLILSEPVGSSEMSTDCISSRKTIETFSNNLSEAIASRLKLVMSKESSSNAIVFSEQLEISNQTVSETDASQQQLEKPKKILEIAPAR